MRRPLAQKADPASDRVYPAHPSVHDGPVIDLTDESVVLDLTDGSVLEQPRTRSVGGGHPGRSSVKRLLDVAIAGAVVVAAAPVMAALAVAVKVTSRGPVLFKQTRVGLHGEHFECFKFRTMVRNADAKLEEVLSNNPELAAEFEVDFKLRKDPRITRIGSMLRKTSLDELPQLFNVLQGDMSLVGPRPLVPDETVRYGAAIHTVLQTRPGLTGLWQVSGRNDLPYNVRVALDSSYVTDWGVADDLRIIARTVPVVLAPFGNGAY